MQKKVVLKPGREKSLRSFHPWVFSGAISSLPNFQNGDILAVYSADGQFLGRGYFNKKSQIIGRMLAFDETPIEDILKINIQRAIALRKVFFNTTDTNAYRIINAEGDFLPGLIVDQYDQVLVVQISTLGMEKLKPLIQQILISEINPNWIYEKSQVSSRKEEGLTEVSQTLFGTAQEYVQMREAGISFLVSPQLGQKTGFFLDQRPMRKLIAELSEGKSVLNCFCYTGGFTLHALKGGARFCESVDVSADALELVKKNCDLNNISPQLHLEQQADVFSYLRESKNNFEIVILDPPAFAKKRQDINQAARGYKEINRLAISNMPPNSLLLTCSCSYHISDTLFGQVLFQAAQESGREVQILQHHHSAFDHPQNIYHPEGSYLKSVLCLVR